MGVLLVRHRYLNIYTSEFYKLVISSKRRYSPIRKYYKNAKIRDFDMNILLSKFAGSSKIWLIVCGTHGGVIGST